MSNQFKVMSHNIRYSNEHDSEYSWQERKTLLFEMLNQEDADIICLQEVKADQLVDVKKLEMFDLTYKMRSDDETAECLPILIKKDKYTKIDRGHFWLAEKPNIAISGWDACLPRIATWVLVSEKASGNNILVMNLHLDHEGPISRLKSIELVETFISQKEIEKTIDGIIITGDFNAKDDEEWYQSLLEKNYLDIRIQDGVRHEGPQGSFASNGFDSKLPFAAYKKIDYIWFKDKNNLFNLSSTNHLVYSPFMISDHLPVIGTFNLK